MKFTYRVAGGGNYGIRARAQIAVPVASPFACDGSFRVFRVPSISCCGPRWTRVSLASRALRASFAIRRVHCRCLRHCRNKLIVVDMAISVDICIVDHLVDIFVGKLLAEAGHRVEQLNVFRMFVWPEWPLRMQTRVVCV